MCISKRNFLNYSRHVKCSYPCQYHDNEQIDHGRRHCGENFRVTFNEMITTAINRR